MKRLLSLLTLPLSLSFPLLLLMVVACGGEDPATEIILVVDSDMIVGEDFDLVALRVERNGETRMEMLSLTAPDSLSIPLVKTLLPGETVDGDVTVTVQARLGGGVVVESVAITRFENQTSKLLRMLLLRECLGNTCSDSQTCDEGGCRERQRELPEFTGSFPAPLMPMAGMDGGMPDSGSCSPPCDDGVACTDDQCVAGACMSTPVDRECDDEVECTVDSCTETGCENTPSDAICEDGDPGTNNFCTADGCVQCGGLITGVSFCDAATCDGGVCFMGSYSIRPAAMGRCRFDIVAERGTTSMISGRLRINGNEVSGLVNVRGSMRECTGTFTPGRQISLMCEGTCGVVLQF